MNNNLMWCVLVHLGTNLWYEEGNQRGATSNETWRAPASDKMRFDEELWTEYLADIKAKGANWVPCEPFVSSESNEKITQILTLARDANINMIRIWGGGVFEKDHFYNECDRLGISVTQDFLMACGNYPEKKIGL